MSVYQQQQTQETIKRVLRAIIYCRVSTDKQEQDGESLEYQEEKGRQYAALHGIEVIIVLKEAKSGFIHYSLREQLTLARQMIRDGMADMIIVWDLRRFSRNFVHSAMIFEEIESAGAQIVSVSENIDNSLTGKLIRSILAWSAESEREKIVEYANRHWQSRLEQNLPMATGRAPYGWQWKDEEKTKYVINKEEAAVRLSIFEMFVELDMSIRSIAHKLTEDGILPPAMSRGAKVKIAAWQSSTVHRMLTDVANIGVLRILKSKKVTTEKGTEARKPNGLMKTIIDGLPSIIPVEFYELAQLKLKNNKSDKSHVYRNPEDFLLKGHIFCKTCGYRMQGSYKIHDGVPSPYYRCGKANNKYAMCPELTEIAAGKLNDLVWLDCYRTLEEWKQIRDVLEYNIKQSLQNLLEDTTGKQHIEQLKAEIVFAKQERNKHPEGSYYYNLISGDIQEKEGQLQRYEEECQASSNVAKLSNMYQQSMMGFLDFLTSMQGRYDEATFAKKRNALDVLGVTVRVHPAPRERPEVTHIETEKEWLPLREAAALAGISEKIVSKRGKKGEFITCKREESRRCTFVHRDEFNRFLSTLTIQPQHLRDNIELRTEISYSPIFTSVQSSLM